MKTERSIEVDLSVFMNRDGGKVLTCVEKLSAVAELFVLGGGRKKIHCLNDHSTYTSRMKMKNMKYLWDHLLDVPETILRAC